MKTQDPVETFQDLRIRNLDLMGNQALDQPRIQDSIQKNILIINLFKADQLHIVKQKIYI